jgi:hypothetical protein
LDLREVGKGSQHVVPLFVFERRSVKKGADPVVNAPALPCVGRAGQEHVDLGLEGRGEGSHKRGSYTRRGIGKEGVSYPFKYVKGVLKRNGRVGWEAD